MTVVMETERTEASPKLLRRPDFRRYWTGHAVSLFGDQVSMLAIASCSCGAWALRFCWPLLLEF